MNHTLTPYEARVVYPNGVSTLYSSGSVATSVVSKPNSSFRTRPTDLWANGTSRDVMSVKYTADPVRYQSASYDSSAWVVGDLACRVFDFTGIYERSNFDCSMLYNRIRTQIRGEAINLGTVLGEYRATCDMFVTWARRFIDLTKALVKRDVRFALPRRQWPRSRDAANAWLEFNYGLKPLLSDVDAGMRALAERILNKPIYIHGKVSTRLSARDTRIKTPAKSNLLYAGTRAYIEETAEAELKSAYRATLSRNYLAASLANYGLLNPAALAWELTPLSFVADWFVNVGDVLSSLDNLIMFDELLVRDSATQTVTVNVYAKDVCIIGGATKVRKYVMRKAPRPISLIVTPSLSPHISASRVITASALIRQAVR